MGSEMCIRDSFLQHALFVAHDDARRTQLDQPLQAVVTIDDAAICLLYTSDAADDLLCVDLGGRRLIKKKNPKHNR